MLFRQPLTVPYIVTQTYAEHLAKAKANGWGWKPGMPPPYYYPGVDMVPRSGGLPDVCAAQAGKVTEVRRDATGYGWHVRIQHEDGFQTIYAHLSEIRVRAGQKVRAGEIIGRMGNTGNSTGPHLHFELRKNGVPVDPTPLLLNDQAVEPVTPPVMVEPGQVVYLQPPYNLRSGPGANTVDLGTVDATMQAEVIQREGDWLQVRAAFWIHRDGVQG